MTATARPTTLIPAADRSDSSLWPMSKILMQTKSVRVRAPQPAQCMRSTCSHVQSASHVDTGSHTAASSKGRDTALPRTRQSCTRPSPGSTSGQYCLASAWQYLFSSASVR